MLRLDINRHDGQSGIRSRIENIYERIAGNDDYRRNEKSLQLIQVCVITISACATGFVNAFAHRERLGWVGASLLAILIMGFVEKFYFALRHGLTTIYKTRKQRFAAWLSYRAIQLSMALNAAILCAWVVGSTLPEPLRIYNKWSIALHFTLALVGVSAVRDADAVVEDRIRKLKAEAIEEDIATIRRAAISDHPLVRAAAKMRGFLDGWSLALQLIRDKPDFSANDVNKQLADHSPRLCLPSAGESTVTDISGKTPAPVNAALELDVPLQSQANSPVQNKAGEDWPDHPAQDFVTGEQPIGMSSEQGGQIEGEQAREKSETKAIINAGRHYAPVSEQRDQNPKNGKSNDRQPLADAHVGEEEGDRTRSEHLTREGERRGEQKRFANDDKSKQSAHSKSMKKGEQAAQVILLPTAQRKPISPSERQTSDEQSAQLLKSILPEASYGNGWWDVRIKPKRFVLMFRWRDPDLQVITLQGVTRDQFESLRQISSDADARGIIREQIVASLRKCSLDPAKRNKARIAAEKLGIDLEEHHAVGIGN